MRLFFKVSFFYYLIIKEKSMPSISRKQQRAMSMALAARNGELKISELKGAALEIYNSDMSNEQIEDFTKLKEGLFSLKDFIFNS